MKKLLVVPCLLAGSLVAQAPAAPQVKFGLWEVVTSTKILGMPAGMASAAPKAITIHSCVTRENYEKTFLQRDQLMKQCTKSNENSDGKTMSFDMDCRNGQMKGHFTMTAESQESIHTVATMTMNMQNGMSMNMDTTADAKWLSADCGDVSPDKPQIVK